MSQASIPEFADTELWMVRATLKERYGHGNEVQIGDAVIGAPRVEADPIRKTKIKVDETPAKPQTARPCAAALASVLSAKTAGAAPDKSDLSPLFWGD